MSRFTAVDCDRIYPNPWQTRLLPSDAQIQTLATSIATHGLIQTPTARPHPTMVDAVQLAIGHRRLAAWMIVKPSEPFPLELQDLSDLQMACVAAVENTQRRDLSAIETALALQHRIKDFGLTQTQAGEPFCLSQSTVAHL